MHLQVIFAVFIAVITVVSTNLNPRLESLHSSAEIEKERHNVLKQFDQDLGAESDAPESVDDHDESIDDIDGECSHCKKNQLDESKETYKQEIESLRVKYEMSKFLKKLNLQTRPDARERVEVPEPIRNMYEDRSHDKHQENEQQPEDFYAQKIEEVIFLKHELTKCKPHMNKKTPSMCFSFQFPSNIDMTSVSYAKLLINKDTNSSDYDENITFLISEIVVGSNGKDTKAKSIVISEIDDSKDPWKYIDIMNPLDNWVKSDRTEHTIQISCTTCSSNVLPINLEQKPCLVIGTIPQKSLKRPSRNIYCGPVSGNCCLDTVYINFTSIGWNDWIIEPEGYRAGFCKGSCERVATTTLATSNNGKALNAFKHDSPVAHQKKQEIVPCCSASSYISLDVFALEKDGSVVRKIIPQMTVTSCGCS